MTIQPAINEKIAAALGDTNGSYERLIGSHICDALGIDPTHRGRLLPASNVSPEAIEWLRTSSAKAGVERGHAAEILAALTEGT